MVLDIKTLLAYTIGTIFLFFVGRVLTDPMKILLKLIYNGILGGLALILINLVGELFGFHIALNAVTAFVAGILGVPGVALLVIVKLVYGI
jgi:inhibitor of the pro-sigma K processing machinery